MHCKRITLLNQHASIHSIWARMHSPLIKTWELFMRQKKTARPKKRILWTSTDLKTLRKSAGKKTAAQIGREIRRSAEAVQRKAYLIGISLRRRAA